jgi:hypothetical protein
MTLASITSKIAFAFVATLCVTGTAVGDVWDSATATDNGNFTQNEITHGFSQVHDLGVQPGPVADQDWYQMTREPFSSYEVLGDGFTGDIGASVVPILQRVTGAGTVLQNSLDYGSGPGFARTLSFVNDTSTPIVEFVRVSNAACDTACDTEDQYRIRAWDTTIAVPRYNNFGGQLTVLIIQNPGQFGISGNAHLWTVSGGSTPVTTVSFTLASRQAAVINLATVNGGVANGTSGTITITHDGRYGQLAVKAVALEPATGFSFDSPGLYKP